MSLTVFKSVVGSSSLSLSSSSDTSSSALPSGLHFFSLFLSLVNSCLDFIIFMFEFVPLVCDAIGYSMLSTGTLNSTVSCEFLHVAEIHISLVGIDLTPADPRPSVFAVRDSHAPVLGYFTHFLPSGGDPATVTDTRPLHHGFTSSSALGCSTSLISPS